MASRDTAPARVVSALVRPLQEFIGTETAGGVVLLAAAAAALAWANMPGETYGDFWGTHIVLDLDVISLDESLRHWVNDGLMAVFFFVVGLEIKRELTKGELADPRRAALPAAAALGGMVVPALIYLALNAGGQGERGWGIPMATDIAFAVGVLALAGPRAPLPLKVFLLALAIADDIGAILVIAVFYTDDLAPGWLAGAVALLALVVALGRAGVRDVVVYLAAGVAAWLCLFESGVHATIAGVMLGLLTPAYARVGRSEFETTAGELIEQYRSGHTAPGGEDADLSAAALRDLEELARERQPVLDRLEHALHPWTSYAVVPLFALANAGIDLGGGAAQDALTSRVAIGVALGLVAGKPLGILLFSWLAVRAGVAALPSQARWPQLAAVAMIAGVGFTVSLFISSLAFEDGALVDEAKIGILAGSAAIGLAGLLMLRSLPLPGASPPPRPAAQAPSPSD